MLGKKQEWLDVGKSKDLISLIHQVRMIIVAVLLILMKVLFLISL